MLSIRIANISQRTNLFFKQDMISLHRTSGHGHIIFSKNARTFLWRYKNNIENEDQQDHTHQDRSGRCTRWLFSSFFSHDYLIVEDYINVFLIRRVMKIIFADYKHGKVKLQAETKDDLWHLSHLIDQGDHVTGKTQRKIKKNDEADAVKRTMTLTILVTTIEYDATLRVAGTVSQGPEDVPQGSHHTISVEPGTTISITKPKWYGYQLQRIKDAQESQHAPLLIVVFDRENAIIAQTRASGYKVLAELTGDVAKKRIAELPKGNFYDMLIKIMEDYTARLQPRAIVLGSPSFWKEELLKRLHNKDMEKKIVQATCSGVNRNAIDEILKRPETKAALAQERAAKEMKLVDELLVAISNDRPAAYGTEQVTLAEQLGAIKTLLVTDALIQEQKKQGTFDTLDAIMKSVDTKKGEIHIISSEHSGGQKLDGIGGIGALLRFPLP
ncbi:mRNA surveillance protein pelota [Candidatus Woesearchaeota archaeon]|nr:mRNA surveillance protein pelota [Candidatus Woesearchaeota archaeon]